MGMGRQFLIDNLAESLLRRLLVDIQIDVELHHHLTLASVDAGMLHTQAAQ